MVDRNLLLAVRDGRAAMSIMLLRTLPSEYAILRTTATKILRHVFQDPWWRSEVCDGVLSQFMDLLLCHRVQADTRLRDSGVTPFLICAELHRPETMRVLLRHGASPLRRDVHGHGVEDYAQDSDFVASVLRDGYSYRGGHGCLTKSAAPRAR